MRVSDYDKFVQKTDHSQGLPEKTQLEIAVYGLAAEVGSVVAEIKKRLLGGDETWNRPDADLIEELGDVMWYCFSLARVANPKSSINIFVHDIRNLKQEIGAENIRASRIARVLLPENRAQFLEAACAFPRRAREMEFEDYQRIAILTARTRDRMLAEVCLAVLAQLSAELFRKTLPPIELGLNKNIPDRPVNDVLGEIAWHISALANLFGLSLSQIAESNRKKLLQIWDAPAFTPLHDEGYPETEQFPRRFEVQFVSVAPNRLRMYLSGRPLGDDLTDNSYDDDGYRYHDIMHLANTSKLGWSPVLRSLLGRKRRSNPRVDEVEDGARARIVEEAVIKAIHSEGERLARLRGTLDGQDSLPLFNRDGDLSYRFFKLIQSFTTRLEVEENHFSEWKAAVSEGYRIFHQLRQERQGTVTVDLEERSITFAPEVFLEVSGQVAGLGSARVPLRPPADAARLEARKRAILDSLGLDSSEVSLAELGLTDHPHRTAISVKATGSVRAVMWERKVVSFRTTLTEGVNEVHALALALSAD